MVQNQQAERQRDLVVNLVAIATDTNHGAFLNKHRGEAAVAQARQIAMYLAHISLGLSQTRVGQLFGRDKSTVGHAVRQVEDWRDDRQFDVWLGELETAVLAGSRVIAVRYPRHDACQVRTDRMVVTACLIH